MQTTACFEQVELQLSREPKPYPTIELNANKSSIFDFDFDDFVVKNYEPHPGIKAPIAV